MSLLNTAVVMYMLVHLFNVLTFNSCQILHVSYLRLDLHLTDLRLDLVQVQTTQLKYLAQNCFCFIVKSDFKSPVVSSLELCSEVKTAFSNSDKFGK